MAQNCTILIYWYILCGNIQIGKNHKDLNFVKYVTWYEIISSDCPIIWSSKLQTEVTLSTTEVEWMVMGIAANYFGSWSEIILYIETQLYIVIDPAS